MKFKENLTVQNAFEHNYIGRIRLRPQSSQYVEFKRYHNGVLFFAGVLASFGWFDRDRLFSLTGKVNTYPIGFFILACCLIDFIYTLTLYKVVADKGAQMVLIKPGILAFSRKMIVYSFAQISAVRINSYPKDARKKTTDSRMKLSLILKGDASIVLFVTDDTPKKRDDAQKFADFIGKPLLLS